MANTGGGNFPNQSGLLKGRGRCITALIKTNSGYQIWNDWFFDSVGSAVNVTTDVGVITFIGFAPTIQTPVNIQPQTGNIVYFGQRPTIETPINISTQTGNLLYSGFEPVVTNTSGGGAEYWNGSSWVTTTLEYYNGSIWASTSAQYYNGSIWVAV